MRASTTASAASRHKLRRRQAGVGTFRSYQSANRKTFAVMLTFYISPLLGMSDWSSGPSFHAS